VCVVAYFLPVHDCVYPEAMGEGERPLSVAAALALNGGMPDGGGVSGGAAAPEGPRADGGDEEDIPIAGGDSVPLLANDGGTAGGDVDYSIQAWFNWGLDMVAYGFHKVVALPLVLPAMLIKAISNWFKSVNQEQRQAFMRELVSDSRFAPNFINQDFGGALRESSRLGRPAFVYLHDPHCPDCASFRRDTLLTAPVCDYLNRNFVCWAGDLSDSSMRRLSNMLRSRPDDRAPMVGIIAPGAGRGKMYLVYRNCGKFVCV